MKTRMEKIRSIIETYSNHTDADSALSEIKAIVLYQEDWISVKKEKPADGQKVIAINRHGEIYHVRYINSLREKWTYSLSNDEVSFTLTVNEITHWMPQPKPLPNEHPMF